MILVKVSQTQKTIANQRNTLNFEKHGTHDTHLNNSRNHGFLAETICKDTLAGMEYANTTKYDLVNWMGETFDVKAHTTLKEPKPDDVATIPSTSTIEADYLIYCYVTKSLNKVWIAGWIETYHYFNLSTLREVGHQGKYCKYDYARREIEVQLLKDINKLMPIGDI
jgi:hypothetical protein